jgi:anti-anti-sigma regulatory factor
MQTKHSTRAGCLVVALTGQIDLSTAPPVQRTLVKDLAERPLALICDLSGVDAIDPVCATIFATVANHPASRWPATSVLLCGAQPAVAELLGRLRVPHFLPLYPTLQDALDAASERPRYLREELRLAPTPTAPAAARRFVRETLQGWQLAPPDQALGDQAALVADELVTMPWSTPRRTYGCGWSYAMSCCISRYATWARGCCTQPPTTSRARAAAACWWWHGWPRSGESTAIPPAARLCGAPCRPCRGGDDGACQDPWSAAAPRRLGWEQARAVASLDRSLGPPKVSVDTMVPFSGCPRRRSVARELGESAGWVERAWQDSVVGTPWRATGRSCQLTRRWS